MQLICDVRLTSQATASLETKKKLLVVPLQTMHNPSTSTPSLVPVTTTNDHCRRIKQPFPSVARRPPTVRQREPTTHGSLFNVASLGWLLAAAGCSLPDPILAHHGHSSQRTTTQLFPIQQHCDLPYLLFAALSLLRVGVARYQNRRSPIQARTKPTERQPPPPSQEYF